MLVITRREGEECVITLPDGIQIVVRVSRIDGDKARIAFDAPRHIPIHRREVQVKVDAGGKTGEAAA